MSININITTVTPAVVDELKRDNEKLREELNQLTRQHRALHETVYQLLSQLGDLKRSLKGK